MKVKNFVPVGTCVVVKPLKGNIGKVYRIGPHVEAAKAGDIVCCHEMAGSININDINYWIVKEDAILGTVDLWSS